MKLGKDNSLSPSFVGSIMHAIIGESCKKQMQKRDYLNQQIYSFHDCLVSRITTTLTELPEGLRQHAGKFFLGDTGRWEFINKHGNVRFWLLDGKHDPKTGNYWFKTRVGYSPFIPEK